MNDRLGWAHLIAEPYCGRTFRLGSNLLHREAATGPSLSRIQHLHLLQDFRGNGQRRHDNHVEANRLAQHVHQELCRFPHQLGMALRAKLADVFFGCSVVSFAPGAKAVHDSIYGFYLLWDGHTTILCRALFWVQIGTCGIAHRAASGAECCFMPTAKTPPTIFQLKITLLGIDPPIWRRIRVPSTIPLSRLHDVFQAVLGWTDTHLHHFERDGVYWGVADEEFEDRIDESKVPMRKVLVREGDSMTYTYDFGDNWRHKVQLEKVLPGRATSRPICVDGRRRRPPEDVGGPSGYEEFLSVTFEPRHEESERFREWAGGTFHAEEFNLKVVNQVLERMRWPVRHRR